MNEDFAIQFFEGKKVRIVWDAEKEKYYFAIIDIVQVLTDSADATAYWRKLKQRLKAEGNETVTNCHALKMPAADGKKRLTDVADLKQTFRLIQSIPSKKAEPVKKWLAEVGAQRIDQMIDPELTFQMAVEDYRRQGYSDRWINERMRSLSQMRKNNKIIFHPRPRLSPPPRVFLWKNNCHLIENKSHLSRDKWLLFCNIRHFLSGRPDGGRCARLQEEGTYDA